MSNSQATSSDQPVARVPPTHAAMLCAVAAVMLCSLLFRLDAFPEYLADEGSWPYEVSLWVESGQPTLDYYVAPGYHWALGLVLRTFGADLHVARLASVALGLATLVILYGAARRLLGGNGAALVAALLFATHYETLVWWRRALIEPYLIFWLVLAIRCFVGRSRWSDAGLAVASAMLMLTKASGVFIFPAFAIAMIYSADDAERGRRVEKASAIAIGLCCAGAVFYWLSRTDPEGFRSAWTAPLQMAPSAVEPQLLWSNHRIGIDPKAIFSTIRRLNGEAPFLSVLAVVVFCRSLFERRHVLVSWWAVGAFAWVAIQTYKLHNYIVPIYPALALAAAAFITDANATAQPKRFLGRDWRWPQVLAALIVLYSFGRLGGQLMSIEPQPAQGGVEWLRTNVTREDRVAAAPYVLMQIDSQDYWHVNFEPSYVPTLQDLQDAEVDYVVLEEYQWVAHLSHRGGLETGLAVAAFAAFGEVVFQDAQTTIYRVHASNKS